MKKDRPTELNKKLKRLKASRDNLKENNRDKNIINQKLRDRNLEIAESRDLWKARSKELSREKEELQQQLDNTREQVELERKRADLLQSEIEEVRKKKRGT